MANQWAQNWGPSLVGIGEDIGGWLRKKKAEEMFQQNLGNFLNSQHQGYAVNNPDGSSNPNQPQNYLGDGSEIIGTGDRSSQRGGTASFQNYQSPRENPFDPSNMGNIANLLRSQGGSEVFNSLSALRPKYNILNQEGGGYDVFKQPFNAPPERISGRPGQFRPPIQNPRVPSVMPTGKVRTENGVRFQEVQDVDAFTKQPIPNSAPRWEPWVNAPQPSGGMGFGEKETTKNIYQQLPKLRDAAMQSEGGIQAIDRIVESVKVAGKTGKPGLIKAAFAPWFELIGEEVPEGMQEAELIQLLGRSVIGPMRLQLIGPGQVTEYEQKILERMSGKGATRQTLLELMNYYKAQSQKQIDEYNNFLEGAESIDANVSKLYKRKGGKRSPNQKEGSDLKSKYGLE
jgi:hypothetical protein